eukprot:TRINITY_DN90139_c0_g1_i1.p1 TRINITY_DN90139_c0_g1~~TRINITY_DN90139_c0_g1_i1.p1  ORF type:complete len:124 (-),score=24.03 TRINITY_DN90139_c0_g1_i1:70-441(-)
MSAPGRPLRIAALLVLFGALALATFSAAQAFVAFPEAASRAAHGHMRVQVGVFPEVTAMPNTGNIEQKVKELQDASLEACLLAQEGDFEAVELCRALSYELNSAEQLLLKRRRAFRYRESDSF